jgi:hypothetical protein
MVFLFIDDNSVHFDPSIYPPKYVEWEVEGEKFKGIKLEDKADDLFFIAGFYVEQDKLKDMLEAINYVKGKHKISLWLPLKWNLKDTQLTKFYEEHKERKKLNELILDSEQLRCELLDILGNLGCQIICSGVGQVADPLKAKYFYEMALTNLLQRMGLHCKEFVDLSFPRLVIVSDWPSSELKRGLNTTYLQGYHFGEDQDKQKYFCGPLSSIDIYPDLHYGITLYSPYLQLADILVGSLRCFFAWCFRDENLQLVVQTFPKISNLFIKDVTGKIIRRGLTVSPKDTEAIVLKRLRTLETEYLKVKP